MLFLKITEKEEPVVLEALYFFGAELLSQMKVGSEKDLPDLSQKIETIDQIIDVIQKTQFKNW